MVSTTFTYLSRLRRDNYVILVDTIHVADAVADTDETYGAYAAAENNTFNNANGSINNANNRNNNANYSCNNMYGVGWGNDSVSPNIIIFVFFNIILAPSSIC